MSNEVVGITNNVTLRPEPTGTEFSHVARVTSRGWNASGELEVPPGAMFSGALGSLQRRDADVVSSGMLITDSRLHVSKFTLSNWLLK